MSNTPNTSNDTVPGGRLADESVAAWTSRVWNLGFVPASGGTERPFRDRAGRRLLYCVNLKTRETAYFDLDTDLATEPAL